MINVAPDLVRMAPQSEMNNTVQGYLGEMQQGFMRASAHGDAHPEVPFCFTIDSQSLWMTQDEVKQFAFAWDKADLERTLREVKQFAFAWVCPAHGEPVQRGNLWEALVE